MGSLEFVSVMEAVATWVGKLPMNTAFTKNELNTAMVQAGIKNDQATIIRRLYQCREERYGFDWYPVCINPRKKLYRKMTLKDAQKFLKRVLM